MAAQDIWRKNKVWQPNRLTENLWKTKIHQGQ